MMRDFFKELLATQLFNTNVYAVKTVYFMLFPAPLLHPSSVSHNPCILLQKPSKFNYNPWSSRRRHWGGGGQGEKAPSYDMRMNKDNEHENEMKLWTG